MSKITGHVGQTPLDDRPGEPGPMVWVGELRRDGKSLRVSIAPNGEPRAPLHGDSQWRVPVASGASEEEVKAVLRRWAPLIEKWGR